MLVHQALKMIAYLRRGAGSRKSHVGLRDYPDLMQSSRSDSSIQRDLRYDIWLSGGPSISVSAFGSTLATGRTRPRVAVISVSRGAIKSRYITLSFVLKPHFSRKNNRCAISRSNH